MASCQRTGAEMHGSRVQHVGSRGKLIQAATANYLTTAQPDKAINVCTVDQWPGWRAIWIDIPCGLRRCADLAAGH